MINNKKITLLTRFLTIYLFIMGILTWIVGMRVYKKTFKTTPNEITRRRIHEKRLSQLENYKHQRFMVESPRNKYQIETIHIRSIHQSEHVMVLVHGIRSNYYDLLPVAFKYLNDGYHVIMYNQRQSGLTGGNNSTFGLYEKYDLEEIVTVARRMYPYGKVGVHGFSMGAATAIMQSEMNEKNDLVDFYILDAPFHSMASAVELGAMRGEGTKIPLWFVKFSGDAVSRLRERISYKDIIPLEVIVHTTKPVLLIHGEMDEVTCPDGSRQLFAAIHHNKRRLEIFDQEGHCTAYYRQEEEYFNRIHKFIGDFL